MILARGMRNNNPLNIIKSEKIVQDHYPDYFTMGTGNGEPGGGVYQGGESAYGDCPRRSTAADETGDAGALV